MARVDGKSLREEAERIKSDFDRMIVGSPIFLMAIALMAYVACILFASVRAVTKMRFQFRV